KTRRPVYGLFGEPGWRRVRFRLGARGLALTGDQNSRRCRSTSCAPVLRSAQSPRISKRVVTLDGAAWVHVRAALSDRGLGSRRLRPPAGIAGGRVFGLPRLFLARYLILAVNVFVTVAPLR